MRVYLEQQAELLRRCAEEDAPRAEERCAEEDAASPVQLNGIASWINCCTSSETAKPMAQQSSESCSSRSLTHTSSTLWDYVGDLLTPRDRRIAAAPGQGIDRPSTRPGSWSGLFWGYSLEEDSRGERAGAAIQGAPAAGKQADTVLNQGTHSRRRARGSGSIADVFQSEEMHKYDWILELGEAVPPATSPQKQLSKSVKVSEDSNGATPHLMLVCTLHEFEGADLENRFSARGLRPDLMGADGCQSIFPGSIAPADRPGGNPTLSGTESEPTRSSSAHSLESAEL